MSPASDSKRDYGPTALRRLLEQSDIVEVNGSPVEVKTATDLDPGRLDPWLVEFEQQRRQSQPSMGPVKVARDLLGYLFRRDQMLLKARAELFELMSSDDWRRDLTTRPLEITRMEIELAGEVRTVWRYARDAQAAGPRPAFVHLHGGAFSAGTPTGRDPFLMVIADQSDTVVFDLDYSMVPERTFPQPVREARALLLHLHDHADQWGLDPAGIAVGGGSAGGNIAAAASLMARDEGDPPVALQVLYNAFLSFGGPPPGLRFRAMEIAPEHRKLAGWQSDPLTSRLTRMLGSAYGGGAKSDNPHLSPALAGDFRNLAPALVITAEMDPLHQSAEHYAGDLARAGVPVRTIRYRGCMHDSVAHVGRIPQAEAAALETIAALQNRGTGGDRSDPSREDDHGRGIDGAR